MFNLFSRGKRQAQLSAVVIPAPAKEDYILSVQEREALSSLVTDAEGFVRIGDVTHGLLHQQPQYISSYMDGRNPNSPSLVDGLRVDVASTSYHEYRIHRDDVVEFAARVRAWRKR